MSNDTPSNAAPGRRRILECMAAAGAGTLWLMKGGVLHAQPMGGPAALDANDASFGFVQVSDSHIGFKHEPNMDTAATFAAALARIDARATPPAFVVHTGDLTHLSRAEEFDTVAELTKGVKAARVLFIPGEHDVIGDNGAAFFERFGEKQNAGGWYSFDHGGVHFVALINVLNLRTNGMGFLGAEQLAWLKKDLAGRSAETPIVVLGHMPLWPLYAAWGWGTEDSGEAMTYLKRFGSVTVLNGHVHQIQQKVEGVVTFHTARSTAYPQPAPGEGPGPGPLKDLGARKLQGYLGIRDVRHVQGRDAVSLTEEVLA